MFGDGIVDGDDLFYKLVVCVYLGDYRFDFHRLNENVIPVSLKFALNQLGFKHSFIELIKYDGVGLGKFHPKGHIGNRQLNWYQPCVCNHVRFEYTITSRKFVVFAGAHHEKFVILIKEICSG